MANRSKGYDQAGVERNDFRISHRGHVADHADVGFVCDQGFSNGRRVATADRDLDSRIAPSKSSQDMQNVMNRIRHDEETARAKRAGLRQKFLCLGFGIEHAVCDDK